MSTEDKRLEDALKMVIQLAQLDFTGSLPVANDGSVYDGLAAGLNMLAEELRHSVVARQELEEKNALFEALVENIPAAVFLKDAKDNFRITLWNRAAEAIFEVPRSVVLGKTTHDLWPKDLADQYHEADTKVCREGIDVTIPEEPSISKTRGEIYLHTRKLPIKIGGETGHSFLLGVCDDITEAKKAREQYQTLFNVIEKTAIVAITDQAGRITYANDNFCTISGYSRSELLGKDHRILNSRYHPKSFFEKMWKDLAEDKPWFGEIRNQKKDGTHYWVSSSLAAFKAGNGSERNYIAIRFDITNEKESQKRLIQASKMSSLGEMASGIAHEINNPLAIISGKAAGIKRMISSGKIDQNKMSEDLSRVELTVDRIAKIIKGLRAFSRNAENDTFSLHKVSTLFEDALELCKERFKDHSIILNVNCDKDLQVACRPSQISQILLNLLSNAFDAVSLLPDKWVTLSASLRGDLVEISVTDSGPGINHEIVEKMMHPFFTTKEVGKGTGLGLSISKGLAEDHKGNLRYDASSKNTSFILELPRAKQSKTQTDSDQAFAS